MFLPEQQDYSTVVGNVRSGLASGLAGKWDRSASESADGPYPDDEIIAPERIMDLIYKAIPYIPEKWAPANKQEFARILFEQIYSESDGHSCVFSGTGPAGMTQFTRGTWVSWAKQMGYKVQPLTERCDPWKAILWQVTYMARLISDAKGSIRKGLINYNGDPARKIKYADGILSNYNNGAHDYALLESQTDPDGTRANAMRVEYP